MNAWCYFFFATADALYPACNFIQEKILPRQFLSGVTSNLKKIVTRIKIRIRYFFFKVNNLSLKNQL